MYLFVEYLEQLKSKHTFLEMKMFYEKSHISVWM